MYTVTGFLAGSLKALERPELTEKGPTPLLHLAALSQHTRILPRQNIQPLGFGVRGLGPRSWTGA